MKKIYIVSILVLLFSIFSCDKKEKIDLPKVDTASVDEILNISARVGGRVTDNGGVEVTERGIYWGTSSKPETAGTKLQVGSGDGIFYEILSGLAPGVKYYVKAYAVNSIGTSYGSETYFTTQINLPTVTTSPVSEFTSTSATVGGIVTDNGGFEISARGVYWGTEPAPGLTGKKLVIGSGDGSFSQSLTGLSRNYIYYVIAFATNLKGTSYGSEISFSTEPELPVVVTAMVLNIKPYSATVGGVVSSSGGTDVTERGVYRGTSVNPVSTGTKLIIGRGTGSYADTLKNLNPGVTYYVRAYAVNSIGTSYGDEKSFLTIGGKPEVTVLRYSDLKASSIMLKGIVSANELSTKVTFEYGITSSYGNLRSADNSPISKKDTVSTTITGLDQNTNYHYRIRAENELGIVYSADSTFRTVITGKTGTVTDSQGNIYQTIGIGYQEWMTENLKVILYNNGIDSIPLVEKDTSWNKLATPAYCWYGNNKAANKETYGALYNWYAVQTGKICPTGWHVPADADFSELTAYLGGAGMAGGKLKETGTSHWNSPNTGATDAYKFAARGAGKRFTDGSFDFVKVESNWWSSTDYSTQNASYMNILFNYNNSFQAYFNKKTGMSVRCVRDK
jgi:uncharacterized protein (TIGR02145 family)